VRDTSSSRGWAPSYPGAKPLVLSRDAASGPVRNLMSVLAASGDLLAASIPALKTVTLASSPFRLGHCRVPDLPALRQLTAALLCVTFRLAFGFGLPERQSANAKTKGRGGWAS
jgi:hypothetical protein